MTDLELDELKQRVEGAHRATPGAYTPAADGWQRTKALASPQQTMEETKMNMSPTFSAPSSPTSVFVGASRNGVSRYTNTVATLAVVAILAFGGWFAATNLQPNGGDNSRFAVLGLQADLAGNDVCDVESLTVDEVLSLTNPFALMGISEQQLEDRGFPLSDRDNLMQIGNRSYIAAIGLPEVLGSSGLKPVTEERYAGYSDVANEYLDCVTTGTIGQIWHFVDPVRVQWQVRNWLPFMVTDEEARELIPQILELPANGIWSEPEKVTLREVTPRVSASSEDAAIPIAPLYLDHFSYMVVAPIIFVDSQGMEVDDLASTPVAIDRGRNIVMGKSLLDDSWYVVGVYNPEP